MLIRYLVETGARIGLRSGRTRLGTRPDSIWIGPPCGAETSLSAAARPCAHGFGILLPPEYILATPGPASTPLRTARTDTRTARPTSRGRRPRPTRSRPRPRHRGAGPAGSVCSARVGLPRPTPFTSVVLSPQ